MIAPPSGLVVSAGEHQQGALPCTFFVAAGQMEKLLPCAGLPRLSSGMLQSMMVASSAPTLRPYLKPANWNLARHALRSFDERMIRGVL